MTETGKADDPQKAREIAPGGLAWRIALATAAHRFFGLVHDAEVAKLISQPQDAGTAGPWPVAYFSLYLQKTKFPTGGSMSQVTRILIEMERVGLLLRCGWRNDLTNAPMQGQLYISQGVRSAQMAGHLWLSEVFGAELIIESYNATTFLICGGEGKPAGTAFALDRTHMVTNRHVIEGLVGHVDFDQESSAPVVFEEGIQVHPSYESPTATPVSRPSRIIAHPKVDVAVIEVGFAENERLAALRGLAFREPSWKDDVHVFGYPYVPGLTERPITVARGHVVSPSTEAAAMAGYPRQPTFLTSAIARPGNSGGPIVAQDGRVIGLVVDSSREASSTSGRIDEASPDAPPFYRGIPAGEVVRAIEYLGFTDVATLETG